MASVLPEGAAQIARGLRAVSERSGTAFRMSSRPGRFRIQKAVYLLQQLGYPAATRYGYTLYLMGPYSPELSRAYYALGDGGLARAPGASDVPARTLDTVVEALRHPDDFLEALSTLLSVRRPREPLSRAMFWARDIKPHISATTWGEVARFTAEHPQLTASTSTRTT